MSHISIEDHIAQNRVNLPVACRDLLRYLEGDAPSGEFNKLIKVVLDADTREVTPSVVRNAVLLVEKHLTRWALANASYR